MNGKKVAVGAVLILYPEPATSVTGLVLAADGLFGDD